MTVRAVITAGGTAEPIDDVRVITNLSTGRFGAALANALIARGAQVTLLASHALASHPEWLSDGIDLRPFGSFDDLSSCLDAACSTPLDLLLMAAAVSDYRPVRAPGKIRSDQEALTLRLVRTPKLLETLRRRCGPDTTLVGFKLLSGVDTDALVAAARHQIATCELDWTVANDLVEIRDGQHPVWLVPRIGAATRIEGTKTTTAAAVISRLVDGHTRR